MDLREGRFKDHGVLLYLSKDLYRGWLKLQVDKDLGRTYAGLLLFTEGLYQLGYINKEVYEQHQKKYSQPLEEPAQAAAQDQKKRALEQEERYLKGLLEIWDDPHSNPNWYRNAVAEAQKYPELEVSKLLLAKVKGEVT